MSRQGNPYGLHRVISPIGELPQGASRLDPSLPIYSNEICIQVDRLNVDSTSFKQLWDVSLHDEKILKKRILDIVRERGKLHNPVTNSGGMLIGTIDEIGENYKGPLKLKKGDRVATLVSLTLTPLLLEEIDEIDFKTGQVKVRGHAILFETGIACPLPQDIPESVALAVLDVCGAPALVLRHVKEGERVLFIGAGKSARLAAAALKKQWGSKVKIACIDVNPTALEEMRAMKLADEVFEGDATQPTFPLPFARGGSGWGRAAHGNKSDVLPPPDPLLAKEGGGFDVVINVANVSGTEMTSLMAVRNGGKIIFFGMGTSFTRVALGAEGIGKDATFLIGSGYAEGHAELALNLVRQNKGLREWFEKKYGV